MNRSNALATALIRLRRAAWFGGLALILAAPVQAQDFQGLLDRLARLERDMQTLNAAVYRGQAVPAPTGAPTGAASAEMVVRMQQLETELRAAVGRVEEMQHAMLQIQDRLDRLTADIDFRLSELEARVSGAATGTGAAASAGATTDSASAALPASAPTSPPASSSGTLGTIPAGSAVPPPPSSEAGAAPASAKEHYELAYSLLSQKRFDEAEVQLADFLARYPDDSLASNAQYWLAETFYVRKDYTNAAAQFASGFQKYPKGPKAPDMLLKLGLSLAALDRPQDACLALAQLAKEFPNAPETVRQRLVQERGRLACS